MSYNKEIRDNSRETLQAIKDLKTAAGSLSEVLLDQCSLFKDMVKNQKENLAEERRLTEEKLKAEKEQADAKKQQKEREDKIQKEREDIERRTANLEQRKQQLEDDKLKSTGDNYRKFIEQEENKLKEDEKILNNLRELNKLSAEGKEDERKKREQEQQQDNSNAEYVHKLTEAQKRDKEAALQKTKKDLESFTKMFTEIPEKVINVIVNLEKQAIESVYSVYKQNAGDMSATLNSSVSEIKSLQNDLSDSLKNADLNKAISNMQVFTEAANLTKAGYTNETRLATNAQDIAIAREIAPTLNYDNRTIKTLMNVFGSDFTHKFAAISTAVQESAGTLIGVSENLSTLINDLEPVYTNAELQIEALQGAADVEATLASAVDAGIIDESNVKEYQSMVTELMDFEKAIKSNNIAVRTAAMKVDYSSANPMDYLEAILESTGQITNLFGQSNGANDRISRSLGASAFGLDSMTMQYNAKAYTDVETIYTNNLDNVYNEQVDKLKDGAYTTVEEQEANAFSNNEFTQKATDFYAKFPQTFKIFEAGLTALISYWGSKLSSSLSTKLTNSALQKIGEKTGLNPNEIAEIAGVDNSGSGTGINLLNALSAATTTKSGHQFIGSKGFGLISQNSAAGLGTAGSTLNTVTGANLSGLGMVAVGGNALLQGGKVLSYALDEENKDKTLMQKISYDGDYLSSIGAGASVGAGIGMMIGTIVPGIGNVVGTAVGAVIGAIGGVTTAAIANHQKTEEQNRILEEQQRTMTEILGDTEGMSELQKSEAATKGISTISIGGKTFEMDTFDNGSDSKNVVEIQSSNAGGLDYVPYDNYVAKLHKGEAVVTAKAAEEYRKSNPEFYRDEKSNNRLVDKLDEQTNKLVSAFSRDKENEIIPNRGYQAQNYVIKNPALS